MIKSHPNTILEKARTMKSDKLLSDREYKLILAVYM